VSIVSFEILHFLKVVAANFDGTKEVIEGTNL
jgi:hypothetical protein